MTKDSYDKNKFYSNKSKEIKVKEINLFMKLLNKQSKN